jgi:hypothetical protein
MRGLRPRLTAQRAEGGFSTVSLTGCERDRERCNFDLSRNWTSNVLSLFNLEKFFCSAF